MRLSSATLCAPHLFPGLVYACGFCGHGFKFAPVIGEALTDLALDGATALPVGFLAAGRFATAAAIA